MQSYRLKIEIECDPSDAQTIINEAATQLSSKPGFRFTLMEIPISAMSSQEFQRIRKISKLNQEEYADELNVTQGHVSQLERGAPISQDIAEAARDILVKYQRKATNKSEHNQASNPIKTPAHNQKRP